MGRRNHGIGVQEGIRVDSSERTEEYDQHENQDTREYHNEILKHQRRPEHGTISRRGWNQRTGDGDGQVNPEKMKSQQKDEKNRKEPVDVCKPFDSHRSDHFSTEKPHQNVMPKNRNRGEEVGYHSQSPERHLPQWKSVPSEPDSQQQKDDECTREPCEGLR